MDKEIKLTGFVTHKENYDTKIGVTKLKCTATFDQITADGLGPDVRALIYDETGMRRKACARWTIDWMQFGGIIALLENQKAMFGDTPVVIPTTKLVLEDVLVQDASSTLKMNLSIYTDSPPGVLRPFLQSVKRSQCIATITPPTVTEAKHARSVAVSLSLFTEQKEEKPTKEAKGNAAVVPPLKKKEAKDDVPPAEESKAETPESPATAEGEQTLASHAVMGTPTRRGARRGSPAANGVQ